MIKSMEIVNAQCSSDNEYTNAQWFNTSCHYFIDHSLKIDNCKLIIATTEGVV